MCWRSPPMWHRWSRSVYVISSPALCGGAGSQPAVSLIYQYRHGRAPERGLWPRQYYIFVRSRDTIRRSYCSFAIQKIYRSHEHRVHVSHDPALVEQSRSFRPWIEENKLLSILAGTEERDVMRIAPRLDDPFFHPQILVMTDEDLHEISIPQKRPDFCSAGPDRVLLEDDLRQLERGRRCIIQICAHPVMPRGVLLPKRQEGAAAIPFF